MGSLIVVQVMLVSELVWDLSLVNHGYYWKEADWRLAQVVYGFGQVLCGVVVSALVVHCGLLLRDL